MAYTPIPIPSNCPEEAAAIVRQAIDPRLSDVHSMLRMPLDQDGLSAGCNFAIADVLFGLIEGVAAVLHPGFGEEGQSFLACVELHYGIEPVPTEFDSKRIGETLWTMFRNPMQHCLGIALRKPDNQGNRFRDPSFPTLWVFRDKTGLTEHQVEQLETGGWPGFLNRSTLAKENDETILAVEAFYVGTRRLINSVLETLARRELAPLVAERLAPLARTSHLSGFRVLNYLAVNSGATMSAQTSAPLSWDGLSDETRK